MAAPRIIPTREAGNPGRSKRLAIRFTLAATKPTTTAAAINKSRLRNRDEWVRASATKIKVTQYPSEPIVSALAP
ncbi:MAG: hypothetical protein BWZ10_00938 [candidate division BRC1 bacterium ADurb.BinA364]|nr:MAG: hypothetical protein BWZ10_00938 [candidate division BRC1 bacterium ADurb.BinA364]